MKVLPELKSLRARNPPEQLAFLGINFDDDASLAEKTTAQEKLLWDQACVGLKSEAARRLGMSSVPTYLVVSPDGKLVVRSHDWLVAKAELEKLLAAN